MTAESLVSLWDMPNGGESGEQELRQVMEMAPGLMAVVHGDRFLFLNQLGAQLMGRAANDLVGTHVHEVLHPSDRLALELCLADSGESSRVLRWVLPSGAEAAVEARSLPFFYQGRGCRLLIGRDTSERLDVSSQLEDFDSMATLGLMLEGVVNGINNPLASVLANLEELCDQLRLFPHNDAQAEALRIAEEARDSGRLVARAAKHLGALRPPDPVTLLDPNEAVRAAVRLARGRIGNRAVIEVEYGQVSSVEVGDIRMVQVLLSLIGQRVDAMPEDREATENRLRLRTWQEDMVACVEVVDNARDLRDSLIRQLMNPDPDAEHAEHDARHRLAVLHGVIQQMGGSMLAEKNAGGGARFELRLHIGPAEVSTERAAEMAGKRDSAPPPGELRLLVVDDEVAIHKALQRSLRDVGLVQCVSSAGAAIDLIKSGAKFDVVLADLIMPSATGLEFADWLQEHEPALKRRLILMTGMGDGENVGHPDVLTVGKPFDIPALRQLVCSIATRG